MLLSSLFNEIILSFPAWYDDSTVIDVATIVDNIDVATIVATMVAMVLRPLYSLI